MRSVGYGKTEFSPVEVEFSLWFRMVSWLKGFFGRRAAFREFCRQNGIDLPVIRGKKYVLSAEYLLNHSRLGQVGEVRDRIILSRYSDLEECEAHLDMAIKEIEGDISNQESYLDSCRAKLENDEKELKKNNDPLMIITFENRINTMRANIENQALRLKTFKDNLMIRQRTRRQNKDNWERQLEIIEAATKSNYNSFCLNYGHKINKVFGYDNFVYAPPEYSKSVSEILGDRK